MEVSLRLTAEARNTPAQISHRIDVKRMTLWDGAETDSPDINRVVRFERRALLQE
jgi:hypothetical protein